MTQPPMTPTENAWCHVVAFVRTMFEAQVPEVRTWLETNIGTSVKDIHRHITTADGLLVVFPAIVTDDGQPHLCYDFLVRPPSGPPLALLGTASAALLEVPPDWQAGDLQAAVDLELRRQPVPDDISELDES